MKTLSALTLVSAAVANQCHSITDPLGPVWTSLEDHFGIDQVASVKTIAIDLTTSLNQQFNLPVDTCLGSFDVEAALPMIEPLLNSASCNAAAQYATNTPALKELKTKTEAFLSSPVTGLNAFVTYLQAIPSDNFESFCHNHAENLSPCVVKELIPTLASIVRQHTSGCCEDLFTMAQVSLGQTFDEFLVNILTRVGKILCGVRSTGLVGYKERCSQTLIHSILNPSIVDMITNVLTILEVPNEHACPAFTGKEFFTTSNVVTSLTPDTPMDCCTVFSDDLVSYLSSLPVIDELGVRDFFAPGACIPGTEIVPLLPSGLGDLLAESLAEKCVRFPNSFSSSCSFSATCTAP